MFNIIKLIKQIFLLNLRNEFAQGENFSSFDPNGDGKINFDELNELGNKLKSLKGDNSRLIATIESLKVKTKVEGGDRTKKHFNLENKSHKKYFDKLESDYKEALSAIREKHSSEKAGVIKGTITAISEGNNDAVSNTSEGNNDTVYNAPEGVKIKLNIKGSREFEGNNKEEYDVYLTNKGKNKYRLEVDDWGTNTYKVFDHNPTKAEIEASVNMYNSGDEKAYNNGWENTGYKPTSSKVSTPSKQAKKQPVDKSPETSPKTKYDEFLNELSDLNSDGDTVDKNLVNEGALKIAISQSSKGTLEGLRGVYENITGDSLEGESITPEQAKAFKEKLIFSITFLQRLGVSNGVYTLLQGKSEDFIQQIGKLPPETLKLELKNPEKLTPPLNRVVSNIITAAVIIGSGGLATAFYNKNNITLDGVMAEVSGEDKSILEKIFSYIGDVFKGKKLAIDFFKDGMSIEEIRSSIISYSKEVINLKFDSKESVSENIKSDYDKAIEFAEFNGLDLKDQKVIEYLRGAVIQDYILRLGKENQDSDIYFTAGLGYVGVKGRKLGISYLENKQNLATQEVEQRLTNRPLTDSELSGTGISVSENGSGKYDYNIPKIGDKIKLSGDIADGFPIKEIKTNGVKLLDTNKVLVFDFSFSNSGEPHYVLEISETNENISTIIEGDKQKLSDNDELRENGSAPLKNEILTENGSSLAETLYSIGHDVRFSKLLKATSRGDKGEVMKVLADLKMTKLGKKYKSLFEALEKNIDTLASWDSYMLGNNATRAKKSPNYDETRAPGNIRAENALAKKTGFPKPSDKNIFRVEGSYESIPISSFLPGQEITNAQFITPLDNSNVKESRPKLHRVSVTNNLSYEILEKTTVVSGVSRKAKIVEGLINSSSDSIGIVSQFNKLNRFLAENDKGKVSLESYKQFLIDGDIGKLGIEGLKVQGGKTTKFIEALAMIAGNICLNPVFIIAYPAFELGDIKQIVSHTGSVDRFSNTNSSEVTFEEGGLGLNPIGIVARKVFDSSKVKGNGNGNGNGTNNVIDGSRPLLGDNIRIPIEGGVGI